MALIDLLPNSNDPLSLNAPRVPAIAAASQASGPMPGPISLPDVGMPQLPGTLRPLVTSPRQQQEQALQAKISAFENPAAPKTGFWHRLGQVSAKIGNIAGDVLAPGTMALIPGTDLNRQFQNSQRTQELAGLQHQDMAERTAASEDTLRNAQGAQLAEETREAPGKAQSTEGLQAAETAGSTPDIATYRSLVGMGMSPSEALREVEHDKAMSLRPPGGEHVSFEDSRGQQFEGTYDPITRQFTKPDGTVVPDARPIPPAASLGAVTMIAPDPNTPGGGIVQRLTPGEHVAPGSQTTAGVNSMNTPTTNQRTAAGRAETVLAMVPEVTSRIDATASQMGPEMGRWNDFMQGKIGMDNPQFSALRSDLLMMSSAVALAHAQGRLPENLREEFDKAINAPKQTPENLKATINAMVPWLQKVQQQGEGPESRPQPQVTPGAPVVGTVEGGFRFKGGDPAKQDSWEKVK